MKHLLIDNKGNIYNRYGDIISISSVSYSMIDKYGFELDEIVDKNILIGKKIITYSKKKIKLAIKPKKIIPTVVILNKNLSMYDNIYMNYSMKTFSSYDGKLWTSYNNEHILYREEYNINLKSLNENYISDKERRQLKKFLNDLNCKVKNSKKIVNNKITYLAILIDTDRYFKNIYTFRTIYNYCKSINDNEICVDKTTNKITVKPSSNIKKLKIQKSVSDDIYDSITEVKDNDESRNIN